MAEQTETLERLEGRVVSISYRNGGNGFTVLSLQNDVSEYTAVGHMPDVEAGEEVALFGTFVQHAAYGAQFQVQTYERRLPTTAAAIYHYLAGGAVKGIGPATAKLLVERFGDETLQILEHEPERLSELRGISRERAQKIAQAYEQNIGVMTAIHFLRQFGFSPEEALCAFRRFGRQTVQVLRDDPYLLCELDVAFERADAIARELGLPGQSPARLDAGFLYILRYNLNNGHTCLPRKKLITVAKRLLDCGGDEADIALDRLLETGRLRTEQIGGGDFLFLPDYHTAEWYIAGRLRLICEHFSKTRKADEKEIEAVERACGIRFEVRQREAIFAALEKGLLMLTGGPGTGKTTTLTAVIQILEARGLEIALAAPTGRAAKRISELTGREAKTLHRLLEVGWAQDGQPIFTRNEKNPLSCDAVIIDELSMVDVKLFEALLRALRLGCRLILVGDEDQLPSVGAGNVLHDLLRAGTFPCVRLDKVFRQAMQSLIVQNAHRIVAGEAPDCARRDADFFLVRQSNPVQAQRTVIELCTRRLPAAYGYAPREQIQVLCPSKKTQLGAQALNRLLQEAINPAQKGVGQIELPGMTLREGDKVMQVKNNYDIVWTKQDGTQGSGVYNGDIGELLAVDPMTGVLLVQYDDRVASYMREEAVQLELAYAITVHKSQGSEFECVVLPLMDVPGQLCYRNLLYTAVTRAKKHLILVGWEQTVLRMVENDRKTLRYTALESMLRG